MVGSAAGRLEIAEMNTADRHQLLAVFLAATTALFIASGMPGISRWAQRIRQLAIAGYVVALALAVIEITIWLFFS
jgi:hypothetical protein